MSPAPSAAYFYAVMREQVHSYPPTNHARAMLVFSAAVIGVALCGAVSAIAPRPHPQVRPIVHQQQLPAEIPHIQASAAG